VKYLICITLLTLGRAEANDAPEGWRDRLSEGNLLSRAGKYSDAAQAFRQALILAAGANVSERTAVGIHDALASVYAEAGQYVESEHEYRHALALAEKSQGRQSLDYGLLVASMAVLPTQEGNRGAAIALLSEIIAVNGRTSAAGDLAIVRSCLAELLMDGKRYVEAESVLLAAQADFAGSKVTDRKRLAELLNHLGMLRLDQGRFDESVGLFRESLKAFEDALGANHPSLVVPLNDLALSYLKVGRLNEAERTLERAIGICSKTLGEEHSTYGVLLENYAGLLRKLGRKHEAKALAARSQKITRVNRSRNGMDSTISVMALRSGGN
jgi:tetratricopeptide (TPR) repeat protein